MRFGSRARSIKNKPKVNREYTVPELKKLLEAAQNECEILQARVNSLESMLQNNGIELPSDLPQVSHT
jgi:kinesin family protein 5